MQPFPHYYTITAQAPTDACVELRGEHLPTLESGSPPEFDGPEGRWSPETLLVAAVGDCLILTFRAVATSSKLPWTSLECEVTGTLSHVDRWTRFVAFDIRAHLDVPAGIDPEHARHVLEKAERNCLISNSLNGVVHLNPMITVAGSPTQVGTEAESAVTGSQ